MQRGTRGERDSCCPPGATSGITTYPRESIAALQRPHAVSVEVDMTLKDCCMVYLV